jgi:TonB-dependent receptor
MDRHLFAKKRVSLAVSLALGAVAASPVMAQEGENANGQMMEEVVVTGIRSSLKRAMDTKRDATGVVDAITAEDIGDFPDTNLAEALQRITGVAIDRARGEGARVTVRGFGADFNLVTLNGRQMPTHSGFGRSFDFGDIASEAVSGVEVYKTAQSDIPTGGIGATINVLTAKPLERPGTHFTLNAKGVLDQSSRDNDGLTPEIAVLLSHTFLDDTLGFAFTGSFQERKSGEASGRTTSWQEVPSIPSNNGLNVNAPTGDAIPAVPRESTYALDEYDRVRENAQLTLQWQPTDTLTATLDYTYARLDLGHRGKTVGTYYGQIREEGTWVTIDNVASPLIYTETGNQTDYVMAQSDDGTLNERKSVGFNLAWDPTDRLSLEFDVHQSSATSSPNGRFGSTSMVAMSAYGRQVASTNFTTEIPVLSVQLAEPLSPDDMHISGSKFENFWADMDLAQAQLSGSFDLSDTLRLDFGLARTEVENYSAAAIVQRDKWSEADTTAYGSISDIVVPASLEGVFTQLGGGDEVNLNFFTADLGDLVQRALYLNSLSPNNPLYYGNIYGNNENLNGSCGNAFCNQFTPNNGQDEFEENTDAAYVQLSYAGTMFNLPFNARAGVRYEETDVTSYSIIPTYEGISWSGGNEFVVLQGEVTRSTGLTGSYDHVLPSLDFDIELTDDIVFRAAYSQTIARAGFGSLKGVPSVPLYIPVNRGVQQQITVGYGNPGLLPYEADNFDLSLEYYYGDASYISVGYFDKEVANWIGASTVEDVVYDENLVHPGLGPLYQEASAAFQAANGAVPSETELREYIFSNYSTAPGVDVDGNAIYGVVGRDNPILVNVDTVVNSDRLESIDGVEMAWQHNFWDSGLGFIANATFASGSAEYDNSSDEPQNALQGLSDTRNFILFYDKYGLQARVAYNWRDTYFDGNSAQPAYVREYEQWDGNITYAVNDALTIYVEGINLTNETFRSYSRSELQVYSAGEQGTRYNIGFRYTL